MERLKILIIMLTVSIIFINNNCSKGEDKMIYQTEEDFDKFISHLKDVCRRKDREELKKMLYVNFEYFGKEKLSREEQIKQFEFDVVLNILNKGGYEFRQYSEIGFDGWTPEGRKMGKFKYIVYFIKDKETKGWKIQSIDEGVLPDEGYTEMTEEEMEKQEAVTTNN